MSSPYFLEILAPKALAPERREILAQVLIRAAVRFSFLGMKDWEVDLGKKEKVLGVAAEFHDLAKIHAPENRFTLFFAKRQDAALYRAILQKSFAELRFGPVRRQAPRDWMREWRRHYKPVKISGGARDLWIYPAWIKIPALRKKGLFVRIHPGQAFGTGTHGTTSLCLELLLANASSLPERAWRVLDFGAGTGILALAAEKLARKERRAFRGIAAEIDPLAREQLRKNARLNGSRLPVKAAMPNGKKYDLLFANVLAPVLLAERQRLLNALAPGGILLLSGILSSDANNFLRDFRLENGMTIQSYRKGDWAAFLVRRE